MHFHWLALSSIVLLISAWPLQIPLLDKVGLDALLQTSDKPSASGYEGGWYDPRHHGGSMIDRAWGHLGEPLNIVISNKSSPDLFTSHGSLDYFRSLGMYPECAGAHLGGKQKANLGDGRGWHNEVVILRESLVPWDIGSCLESVIGGNHLRAWRQTGPLADSGAWFLAVSKEVDARGNHRIRDNGYNIGRDAVVSIATQESGTRYRRRTWTTTVEWIDGLIPPGSAGINHGIAQDGRVAVLTATEY